MIILSRLSKRYSLQESLSYPIRWTVASFSCSLKLSSSSLKPRNSADPPIKSAGSFYQQLIQQQQQHRNHLLMARVGDFYEFYFEQAELVSQLLGMKLGKTSFQGTQHPFTGFPSFKLMDYVRLLLNHGYSIAKWEQYERLQPNGEKLLVRYVDRIYTPATLIEEELAHEEADDGEQYLIALHCVNNNPGHEQDKIGFAAVDLSSGKFYADSCTRLELPSKLATCRPRELLISSPFAEKVYSESSLQQLLGTNINIINESTDAFCREKAIQNLAKMFGLTLEIPSTIEQRVHDLILPRHMDESALYSINAVLEYIMKSHHGLLPLLDKPLRFTRDRMVIDLETQKSLELTKVQRRADSRGSLIRSIDKTATVLGGKMLRSRIRSPFASIDAVNKRHDMVAYFLENNDNAMKIKDILSTKCRPDVTRSIQNLKLNQGGLWHVAAIYEFTRGIRSLREILCKEKTVFSDLNRLEYPQQLLDLLEVILPQSFVDGEMPLNELPRSLTNPGTIRPEAHSDLQEAYESHQDLLRSKNDLIAQIRQQHFGTQSVTLRLDFRKPLGAFIEVEHSETLKPPSESEFQHLQSLGGSSKLKKKRFKFKPWTVLHAEIQSAHDRYLEVERAAFKLICERVYEERDTISQLAQIVSELDLAQSFARIARDRGYIRPTMTNDGSLHIENGAHPALSEVLLQESKMITKNTCNLSAEKNLWLITGANMGGKSTFLRQNALLIIMAHAGSFIPAKKATIGIVDQLFSRVGSSDDLSRHQSSFMVEMSETAHILQQATNRSFVIMDEVGRGTSSRDGVAIAWGIIRYLHDHTRCRTLFATHYHELADVMKQHNLQRFDCYQTHILLNNQDGISLANEGTHVFTHEIVPGISRNSYGLLVAQKAGLPSSVLQSAQQYLDDFSPSEH